MNDLKKELSGASAIMGMLPEDPGYNGSRLIIDDVEAARIADAIDAGIKRIEELEAALRSSEAKEIVPVPIETLKRWAEALRPFWFSEDGEEEYNNDGVIDTTEEIDAIISSRSVESK